MKTILFYVLVSLALLAAICLSVCKINKTRTPEREKTKHIAWRYLYIVSVITLFVFTIGTIFTSINLLTANNGNSYSFASLIALEKINKPYIIAFDMMKFKELFISFGINLILMIVMVAAAFKIMKNKSVTKNMSLKNILKRMLPYEVFVTSAAIFTVVCFGKTLGYLASLWPYAFVLS